MTEQRFSIQEYKEMARNASAELKDKLVEIFIEKYGAKIIEDCKLFDDRNKKYATIRTTGFHDNRLSIMSQTLGVSKCKLVGKLVDEYYEEKVLPYLVQT